MYVPVQHHQGVTQVGSTSRIGYVLLGLFLGYLGAYNFYAGYHGRAIFQLLFTLFIGWWTGLVIGIAIWNIVEIIITEKDARGMRMC